ncbi:4-hydroxy-2-oxovalerate aldolase [Pseudomonadales bacterium]|nr:4-hydroxy-2-oxovalerate aldolase [Pseudomonadales bacterium]
MVEILDTTLRDGSYVTNFQFNLRDTALIASKLDQSGVPFIEVGHGLGMNAGTRTGMKSHFSDEAYLEVCQDAVRKNQWGMFFIPGIGRLEDIDLAAKYGMNFIRIGIDVDNVDTCEPYIKKAKDLGLYVASNLMKSYTSTPENLGLNAYKAATYGADIVVIVDSAGGMFPEDIDPYFNAIRSNSDVDIGFHGHNNMGLGIANGIRAAELGCAVVDTSIRGLGRSAGNTVTEIFLLAMKRKGFDLGVNVTEILNLAETVVDPLLSNYQQVDSIGIISGFAQFHSGFLDRIMHFSSEYRVDPRKLIVGVSEVDKVNVSNELVERIAIELAGHGKEEDVVFNESLLLNRHNDIIEGDLSQDASRVARKIHSDAGRINGVSVFNIVQAFRPDSVSSVSSVIHQGSLFVVGSAEVTDMHAAICVADAVDSSVDYVLIDIDNKMAQSLDVISELSAKIKSSRKLFYSDMNIWSDSVVALVTEIAASSGVEQRVKLVGDNILSEYLRIKLSGTGMITVSDSTFGDGQFSDGDVIIYCEPAAGRLPAGFIGEQSIVIDAIVGSLTESEVNKLTNLHFKIIRVDMHSHIESLIKNLVIVSEKVANISQHSLNIEGVDVVSSGVVAPRDTVIVDSASQPNKVYGIADGSGFLLPGNELTSEQKRKLARIEVAVYC